MATLRRPSAMTLVIGAVSALLVAGVAWPYLPYRKAELLGDVYVTTTHGDVKRLAEVAVVLAQGDDPAWQALLDEYAAEVRAAGPMSTETHMDRIISAIPKLKYAKRVETLLAQHRVQGTHTDINGRFHVTGLKPGRYYVVSAHNVFDTFLHWIVPIQLRAGANRLDLSLRNEGAPP